MIREGAYQLGLRLRKQQQRDRQRQKLTEALDLYKGTDVVALCCYFDRFARTLTLGEAHFGLRPAARRDSQAEALSLCCYGVEIRLVDTAGLALCQRLRETLPPEFVNPSESSDTVVRYVVNVLAPQGFTKTSEFVISCDDLAVFATAVEEELYWWLRRDIERTVARRSPQMLFAHAGVVSWRGVGIIIPGRASIGKSTLVAELVQRGAVYYSDTFAVFDDQGNLHPYRGLIGLGIEGHPPNHRLVQEGESTEPLPISLIVDAPYTPGAAWRPTVVRGTYAALSLVDSTVLPRDEATRMQQIATHVSASAVTLRGPRSEAKQVAAALLDMVDDALVSHALDTAGDNLGRLADELARVAEIRLRSPNGRLKSPPRRLIAHRYVRKLNILPPDDYQRLLQYVRSGEISERRDEILDLFDRRLHVMLPFVRQELNMVWFPVGRIEWQLTAHSRGGVSVLHADTGSPQASGRCISCVYSFHQLPKRFSGGELKIHDTWFTPTGSTSAATYTRLEPIDNSVVFFPSDSLHEVCPVYSETEACADCNLAITIRFWEIDWSAQVSNLPDHVDLTSIDALTCIAQSEPTLPSPAEVRRPAGDPHPKRLVAVVVPTHRFPLSHDDQIAIWHLRKHLGEFDRYMIGRKPWNL